MKTATRSATPLAALLLLAGCGDQPSSDMEFARPEVTAGLVLAMPVTTTSDAALEHFKQGQRAQDMGRFSNARAHYRQAVEADSNFALAYLRLANTAPSLDEFRSNLDLAVQHAEHASEAERLLVQVTQQGFRNDVEGQLNSAKALVDLLPESPRALLTLASIQTSMGQEQEARQTMMKAGEVSPRFAVAYAQLGNSYLLAEPRDVAKAEAAMRKVVELEPDESMAHDLLGDAYRAAGQLEQARDHYTMAAERAPTEGLPLQQRGHVNSFLGNYDAARTDYDSAMALGRDNQRPAFGVWRALVSVHAGNPDAAIDELEQLVASIDGMGIPEPTGLKINALSNLAWIAIHTGRVDRAEQALATRTTLMREESERVGTDEFRRGQEANIAYFDGLLAARKGDFATAQAKTAEFRGLVEPDANPRKLEPMHEMMGYSALLQKKYAEAAQHYAQGNPNSIYNTYQRAVALEGAGRAAQAKPLFAQVASYNFNNTGSALVRKAAMEKR